MYADEKCEWLGKAQSKMGLLSRDLRDAIQMGGYTQTVAEEISQLDQLISFLCHCEDVELGYAAMGYGSKLADLYDIQGCFTGCCDVIYITSNTGGGGSTVGTWKITGNSETDNVLGTTNSNSWKIIYNSNTLFDVFSDGFRASTDTRVYATNSTRNSEYIPYSANFGYNVLRTYLIGTGSYLTPQKYSRISQSEEVTSITTSDGTNSSIATSSLGSYEISSTGLFKVLVGNSTIEAGTSTVSLGSFGGSGVRIITSSNYAALFTGLLTESRTYQFPNASGTLALLSDITGGVSDFIFTNVNGFTGTVTSSTTTPTLSLVLQDATTLQSGQLTSTDWNTFNNKLALSSLLTGLSITGSTITSSSSIIGAFGALQNQINGILGGASYQGTWNASTNTPTLTSSVGTNGFYYVVSVDGSTDLNGITDWKVGDWAIFNGTAWQKVDNTDAVSSVNGAIGAVVITTTGTTNRISVTGGGGLTPTIDIAATYVGQSSITTLGTIGTGVWQGTPISDAYLSSSFWKLGGQTTSSYFSNISSSPNAPFDTRFTTFNATTFTVTGNTTINNTTITSVSSTVNIRIGDGITGTNIPTNTFVTAITSSTITINNNASNNGTGITFTVTPVEAAYKFNGVFNATSATTPLKPVIHIFKDISNSITSTYDSLLLLDGTNITAGGALINVYGQSAGNTVFAEFKKGNTAFLRFSVSGGFPSIGIGTTSISANGSFIETTNFRAISNLQTNTLQLVESFFARSIASSNTTITNHLFSGTNSGINLINNEILNSKVLNSTTTTYRFINFAPTVTNALFVSFLESNLVLSGTSRWNLYFTQTAPSWSRGFVLLDGASSPTRTPHSNLDIIGSASFRYQSVNTNTTLDSTNNTIDVDASGAARVITLPTAVGIEGREYNIRKLDASVNTVTIACTGGQTINAATTLVLSLQYQNRTLRSNGTNWIILNGFL